MSVCSTFHTTKDLALFIIISLRLIHGLSQEHRVMRQSCEGDWVRYGESCYRYYTSQKAWIHAFKTCQSDDGFLTDVENQEEQTFLQNLTSGTKFWISASDSVGDWFKWLWYGGINPWNFTNWDTGQPDNSGGNEDCAVVKENGKWDDMDCSSTLPFVCKRKVIISFCDSTWKTKDGGCFKVSSDYKNWLDAQRACQLSTATLANIDSISKQNYVFGLFRVWLIWIGGFHAQAENAWAWAGTNLPWVYQNWGPGEPNNVGIPNCLGLAPTTGLWDGGNCVGHYIQYICERRTFYLTEDPVLTMAVDASSNEARFICAFVFNISDVDMGVEWYLNENVIKKDILSNETESLLLERDITVLKQGDQVKCVVTPCMPGNCSLTGSSRESNLISAKVQAVSEARLTVAESSGPAYINVTSTVPPHLFCERHHRNSTELCNPHVSIELVKGWERRCVRSHVPISQAVFGANVPYSKPCSYQMKWSSEVLISVKASLDGLVDRNQYRSIRVLFTASNVTTTISTVQMTVVDQDRIATCSSINDPHMTTFDRRYYDNYLEGEFVLYRHKSLPYEVRVFYRRCNRVAACNCAVAVKSGDDIILIDFCGPSVGPSTRNPILTMKMYLNGELTPGTEVISIGGGKTYEVVLPTGARIFIMTGQVILNSQFLNVQMVASTFDFNQTEGLCGTFDGDKNNDFLKRDGSLYTGGAKHPNEFSLSWRVPDEESLFRGDCRPLNSNMDENGPYCDCMEGETAICQERVDVMTCAEIEKRRGLLSGQKGMKLITKDLIDDAESPPSRCGSTRNESFQFDPEYRQPDPEWPTLSNITEPEARNICENFLKSDKAGALCVTVSGIDLAPIVQGCINDIQLTDSTDWAKESLDNLLRECITIVETDDWSNVTRPPVLEIICPNNCWGNGQCSDGLCQCSHPWIGDDCSVNKTLPPELNQVGNGEPCDSVCSECLSVRLYGENFADVENLTCHYRILNVFLESTSDVMSIKAKYFNSHMVKCTLPDVALYEIAVSNNGKELSEYIHYIVFNSRCHRCNSSGCSIRNDICKINDECQEHGFVNPTNKAEICNVTLSKFQWSTLNVENIPIKSYLFHDISGQFVITRDSRLLVEGSGFPTLTESLRGKAIMLNGQQYLSLQALSNTSTCFGDVENSPLGITITLDINLKKSVSTCFIFSSGGEEFSTYGYAMWFENDFLYAKVSKRRHEWIVSTSGVMIDRFIHIQMIWSLQSGLQLIIDYNRKASSRKCISRPESNYTPLKEFVLGGSSKKDKNCKLAIEQLSFVCASVNIINTTNTTDLPFTERTTTAGTLVNKSCVESKSSTMALETAVISTSVLSGGLFCTVCCLLLLFGYRRRRKSKRCNHILPPDQIKNYQITKSKRAVLNPVFADDSGTSAYRHHWTGETPVWRAYGYGEQKELRVNQRSISIENPYVMRVHEAEIRFPLGQRYDNAVYGLSDEQSTSLYARSTREINAESTDCSPQTGISSTGENVAKETFYQRRAVDQEIRIPSPELKNELAVNTASKETYYGESKYNSHLRSTNESNTMIDSNELIPGNGTKKGKEENQNPNKIVETEKTILSKTGPGWSKERLVCSNCSGHYESYEGKRMLNGAYIREAASCKDRSCQTDSFYLPSGKTQNSLVHFHYDQSSVKEQNEVEYKRFTGSHYLSSKNPFPVLPDFQESRWEQQDMLNVNGDKIKGSQHTSKVGAFPEENQRNRSDMFDVTRESITEKRNQSESNNQSYMLYEKMSSTERKLEEEKQTHEIQTETIWMLSEDTCSSLSGGSEIEMKGINMETGKQRRDSNGESYEIRTEWIPDNTSEIQATFHDSSSKASSEVLNHRSGILERDMISTDSPKYLVTHYKNDNGKQVISKYISEEKTESKESRCQFPEARSFKHSVLKEKIHSTAKDLNEQRIVGENKKECPHCNGVFIPDAIPLQSGLAMDFDEAKLELQTGGTGRINHHKLVDHTQSVKMVGLADAQMFEEDQENSINFRQFGKTSESDAFVEYTTVKHHSDGSESIHMKHQFDKQKQGFAAGFQKHDMHSDEENAIHYQSRVSKFRNRPDGSKEYFYKDHHSESVAEGQLQKKESVNTDQKKGTLISKIDFDGNDWTNHIYRESADTSNAAAIGNSIYTTYAEWKIDQKADEENHH